MEENKIVEERKKKFLSYFKKNYSWIFYLILGVILWINVYIRTLPMKINPNTGKPYLWDITKDSWTLGPDLDPFLFLRWAKTIVEQGALPKIDYMRYFPLGYDTSYETNLLPNAIVYIYKFLKIFSENITVEYAAIILPVIFSVFMVIGFFLLVRKIFNDKGEKISNIIALIASAFLVTLPSLLGRTIAGIPEKESMAFAFMFFAFYFFLSALDSKETKKYIINSILAGVFTALMGLVWGGVMIIFVSISILGLIMLVFEKIEKRELIVYLIWIFCSFIFWVPFTKRIGGIKGFITSTSTGSSLIVITFIVFYFLIFKSGIIKNQFLDKKIIKKIPKPFIAIIISLIFLVILSFIVLGSGSVINIFKDVSFHLMRPYEDRLSFTVAENKQPFFKSDWEENFGPTRIILFGLAEKKIPPLFFWLFIIGTLVIFYETILKFRLKEKIILILSYALFLFALIFSRISETSLLNGESNLSKVVYIGGYLIFFIGFLYVYYERHKSKEEHIFKETKTDFLFIFSLLFVGIVAARSAIRLIMVLAPIAVIPLSYLSVFIVNESLKKRKEEIMKVIISLAAIIIVLSSVYVLYYNYQVSKYTAIRHVPSAYTYQWQEAMKWVRENTPKDAVFGHWWDYGYWVQSIGERATMLDGGNAYPYWNYLMGRHVLTAENQQEALDLLYTRNVTYYLIDSTEIGKYSAYSSIGSDENYDRFSWIGTFILDESQTMETRNQTLYVYRGGVALDEDIVIENEGKQIIIPGRKSGVGALIVPKYKLEKNETKNQTNITEEFGQPYAIMVNKGQQYKVDLRYIYFNGKLIDFKKGIEGCVYIMPSLIQDQKGLKINPIGASMFLSPRNMRALWVRLYLLGEEGNFELVHTESSYVTKILRNQGINISEIVYFEGIQGPIKIWKIHFTGNETYNPEYLMTNFPKRIAQRYIAKL